MGAGGGMSLKHREYQFKKKRVEVGVGAETLWVSVLWGAGGRGPLKHRGYVSAGGGEVIETSWVWVCLVSVCVCVGGGGVIKILKHRG